MHGAHAVTPHYEPKSPPLGPHGVLTACWVEHVTYFKCNTCTALQASQPAVLSYLLNVA
jgi:hypothetical protein